MMVAPVSDVFRGACCCAEPPSRPLDHAPAHFAVPDRPHTCTYLPRYLVYTHTHTHTQTPTTFCRGFRFPSGTVSDRSPFGGVAEWAYPVTNADTHARAPSPCLPPLSRYAAAVSRTCEGVESEMQECKRPGWRDGGDGESGSFYFAIGGRLGGQGAGETSLFLDCLSNRRGLGERRSMMAKVGVMGLQFNSINLMEYDIVGSYFFVAQFFGS
ncbi:hypothetical protein LZ30DRAFT_273567 [Colletotrichum cereale]|nr:hypothetical protein LZ30DRAFT_273567 [Colletotrichum cereale]